MKKTIAIALLTIGLIAASCSQRHSSPEAAPPDDEVSTTIAAPGDATTTLESTTTMLDESPPISPAIDQTTQQQTSPPPPPSDVGPTPTNPQPTTPPPTDPYVPPNIDPRIPLTNPLTPPSGYFRSYDNYPMQGTDAHPGVIDGHSFYFNYPLETDCKAVVLAVVASARANGWIIPEEYLGGSAEWSATQSVPRDDFGLVIGCEKHRNGDRFDSASLGISYLLIST